MKNDDSTQIKESEDHIYTLHHNSIKQKFLQTSSIIVIGQYYVPMASLWHC